MKVYKIELMVIDHDGVGDEMASLIEGMRSPNHCINPTVMNIESREIGTWDDDHPLNHWKTLPDYFKKLFENED
jgi:hypothetical protein